MISVIVPVYNVEKYLKKCIESILNQTYDDFELILVDDGSTDKSRIICDEYINRDNVVVIHKHNGGLADARNVGIDVANGDYITFIDSDDYVRVDFLEKLISIAEITKSPIVISQFIDFYENDKEQIIENQEIKYSVISKEECYYKMLLQEGIDVSSTAKLFQNNIFDNIRFVKGQLYEDINIISDIIEQVDNVAITDYRGYFYLQRTGSIMYGSFCMERLSLLEATEKLINLMEEKYPLNVQAAKYRNVYAMFHLLGRSVMDKKYIEVSKMLRKKIIENNSFILNSGLFNKKDIIALRILKVNMSLYKVVWKVYKFFS